jgi:hypothetical protein
MKIDRKHFIPAMVLGAVFIGIIIYVQPYPMAAKRLLVLVSILGMILTAITMVHAAWPRKEKDDADQEAIVSHSGKQKHTVPVSALMGALAWITGILLIVYLLGFQFGLPLYTCLYSRLHGGSWLGSIILGLGVLLFLYLIFHFLLDAITPPGLLFELFTEYFDY